MTFCFSFRAKPKPSKKARLDKAAEEDVAPEHDQAPDREMFTSEDIPNDPPLQDDVIPEEGLVNTPASADPPTSSIQIEKSHTPADQTAAPTQTGESKDDDVVITGVGRSEPGNPVTLTKHTIKEDFSALNKGKWDVELETYAALNAEMLKEVFFVIELVCTRNKLKISHYLQINSSPLICPITFMCVLCSLLNIS